MKKELGKIVVIGKEIVRGNQGQFLSRELVIDREKIGLAGFKVEGKTCDRLNGLRIGDEVEVEYEIETREGRGDWEGRYFTNLVVSAIETIGKAPEVRGREGVGKPVSRRLPPMDDDDEDDDIPF